MQILSTSDADLDRAARAIAGGLLVALPTETVYGLGADAFNPEAVARIFEAKARPTFDPLIVHIADLSQVDDVAFDPSPAARALMEALWPGPLTLILPKRPRVPDLVTSGLDTVALRFPAHPVARKIIARSGTAVAAPSANPFGYLSPTTAAHVASMLGDKVDFIVDGGASSIGVESTVLDMTGRVPTILRPGGMEKSAIEAIVGRVDDYDRAVASPTSPGQLPSHYAPHLPLVLVPYGALAGADLSGWKGQSIVALAFSGASRRLALDSGRYSRVECLSEEGGTREAAARLFALLHELDGQGESGARAIVAERAPDSGLGPAINDRLYKASKK